MDYTDEPDFLINNAALDPASPEQERVTTKSTKDSKNHFGPFVLIVVPSIFAILGELR